MIDSTFIDNLILISVVLAIVVLLSVISVRKKYLTLGGALLANLFGLIIIFLVGIASFLLILIAFIAANLATSYRIEEKIKLKLVIAKKPIRDWKNVSGNGLPILIFSILEYIYGLDKLTLAFVASISTFLSDTMSTEIGVLSRKEPVLITSLRSTHKGRSGAISLEGTLIGIISSLMFSLIAFYLVNHANFLEFVFIVTFSSVLANFLDSFLGATLQACYFCNKCNMFSEEKIHVCGSLCNHVSGVKFINNHMVNFLSILAGGIVALVLASVIPLYYAFVI